MVKHINEIQLDGDSAFIVQFNKCSEYFIKCTDKSLAEEEREKYFNLWFEERQRLELGIY